MNIQRVDAYNNIKALRPIEHTTTLVTTTSVTGAANVRNTNEDNTD